MRYFIILAMFLRWYLRSTCKWLLVNDLELSETLIENDNKTTIWRYQNNSRIGPGRDSKGGLGRYHPVIELADTIFNQRFVCSVMSVCVKFDFTHTDINIWNRLSSVMKRINLISHCRLQLKKENRISGLQKENFAGSRKRGKSPRASPPPASYGVLVSSPIDMYLLATRW